LFVSFRTAEGRPKSRPQPPRTWIYAITIERKRQSKVPHSWVLLRREITCAENRQTALANEEFRGRLRHPKKKTGPQSDPVKFG
jgi:hypothetical protein